jgi:hypothetical protein
VKEKRERGCSALTSCTGSHIPDGYRIGFTTDRPAMKARGSWTHKASFLGEFLVGQNATVVQYGEGEFA